MSVCLAPVRDCVSFRLDGQLCSLPVSCVREVLDSCRINRVPLAPPTIAGHLNLRGRVVTAIDPGALLPSSSRGPTEPYSNDNGAPSLRHTAIVLEHEGVLYALLADDIGEVIHLEDGCLVTESMGRSDSWVSLSLGLIVRADEVIILLDPVRLIAALWDNRP